MGVWVSANVLFLIWVLVTGCDQFVKNHRTVYLQFGIYVIL